MEYLVFEGGGGRGAVYLGAVVALEQIGFLPLKETYNSPIKGIAGSSAGAITAFALAIGMTSNDLAEFMKSPESFSRLIGVPRISLDGKSCTTQLIRSIEPNPSFHRINDIVNNKLFEKIPPLLVAKTFGEHVKHPIHSYIKGEIREKLVNGFKAFLSKININNETLKNFHCYKNYNLNSSIYNVFLQYLNQLINTTGLTPGNGVRDFFKNLIWKYFYELEIDDEQEDIFSDYNPENFQEKLALSIQTIQDEFNTKTLFEWLKEPAANKALIKRLQQLDITLNNEFSKKDFLAIRDDLYHISFKDLYEITKVDLRITGCNISKNSPRIFSKDFTPEFPVIEAIGLSMSIPFAFSPVYISKPKFFRESKIISKKDFYNLSNQSDNQTMKYHDYLNGYYGFYGDGGINLNYPIHIFNSDADKPFQEFHLMEKRKLINTFNPNVLGFRLGVDDNSKGPTNLDELRQRYKGDLMNTIAFYHPEAGQITGPDVKANSIELDTGNIDMLDFVPKRKPAKKLIKAAYDKCRQYFSSSPTINFQSSLDNIFSILEWDIPEPEPVYDPFSNDFWNNTEQD